jgi:hypothetical protein
MDDIVEKFNKLVQEKNVEEYVEKLKKLNNWYMYWILLYISITTYLVLLVVSSHVS